MTGTKLPAALAAAALALAGPALGADRPSEDELFGAPAAEPEEASPPAPPGSRAPGSPRPEEAELFGSTGSPAAQPPPPEPLVPRDLVDPLALGGQLYLRAQTTWQASRPPADWVLASPNLLDLYLDARPNDRVRAFVLGRMSYDPTLGPEAEGAAQPLAGIPGVRATPQENPRAVLDQLWVNFDVRRQAFVTVGKQHVKWGVGRFWNPTDYLHPVRRDPLAVFDARTGVTMVRVHVPWERRGWNFHAVALLEDAAGEQEPVNRLGRVAAGGRAEIVYGAAELGLDALVQDGRDPRFGVDLSAGVLDLDLYAEASLRRGIDGSRWRAGPPTEGNLLGFVRDDPTGFTPQVVLGGSWSANYTDQDVITVGAEYFYNHAGYEDRSVYPFLLAGAPRVALSDQPPGFTLAPQDPGAFRPFYLGRHYAGAFVLLPRPGAWNDTTFTLSVLGNLSDRSFVARLDHSLLALTYLRVETFVAGHLGRRGGEFRFGVDVPPELGAALGIPPGAGAAPIVDVGIALRVSL